MMKEQQPSRVLLFDDLPRHNNSFAHELSEAGIEVVGAASTPADMHELVRSVAFDVAVLDVLVGPSEGLVGLSIGLWLREHLPRVGVLMFTSYDSPFPALRLMSVNPIGVGYLLKNRVHHTSEIVSAISALRQRQNVLDSRIKKKLVPLQGREYPGERLTGAELDTLRLIVDGKTNEQIAHTLNVSPKTIEARCSLIFRKLGISEVEASAQPNLRVATVILWVNSLEKFSQARDVAPIDWPPPDSTQPISRSTLR
ncbi:MAG: response regulator transcription factor [Actinobacteria bacterium]|nr:response regulator transcription factor [Actinomycetota bacterium]